MDKKKVLIFAHYYYPDTASTGQILKDQAEGMAEDFDVTVICTVPSYSGTIDDKYKANKLYIEIINKVKVIRVRVPEFTKSNKFSRIKNIASYFMGSLKAAALAGHQDYIFAISQPPILGGVLGFIGKKIKKAKLVYCIQDFNPEQIAAVGYFRNPLLLKLLMYFDKHSCKKSDLIITVGRDLIQTLEFRFKGKHVPDYVMINNWIDEKEIYPLPAHHENVDAFRRKFGLQDKFVFMYSGNIGLYYDLENLIKVTRKFKNAKTSDGREVIFAFVGAGAVLENLRTFVKHNSLGNVIFIPYQEKENLIYSLNAADIHWCVNAKRIKGVSCPSKFYGEIAVSKPVLGVLESGSEIHSLIKETGCGLVSEPGDYEHVQKHIQWFIDQAGSYELEQMGKKGHDYLVGNLTKDISVRKYINAIKAL